MAGGLDRVVAEIAATLHTPFPAVRQTRITLLIRMHIQAHRIMARAAAATRIG